MGEQIGGASLARAIFDPKGFIYIAGEFMPSQTLIQVRAYSI